MTITIDALEDQACTQMVTRIRREGLARASQIVDEIAEECTRSLGTVPGCVDFRKRYFRNVMNDIFDWAIKNGVL